MEINKKNRTELKSYFLANKIPTQKDFGEFIDAQLNQAEDGIAKVQGSPVALEAEGDPGGPQEVLNLFGSFADANPSWGISLNPRVDPVVPGSNQPGLNVKDAGGTSRLFIRSAGGEVGIGTIEPASRLSVQAREDASMISVTSGSTHIFEVARENSDGVLSVRGGNGALISRLSGTTGKPSFLLSRVGLGTDKPETQLHLSGDDTELRITDNKTGGQPRLKLESNNGQPWWVQGGETFQITPDRSDDGVLRLERDGHLKLSGGFTVGVSSTDINADGSLYRKGSGTFLTIDDHFYIRHPSRGNQMHLNTTNGRMAIGGVNPSAPLSIDGPGKYQNPDWAMHITRESILFGGYNRDKHKNSGCISAGTHVPNTLTIVGLSETANDEKRKVEVWAEAGMTVRGHVKTPVSHVVAFSAFVTNASLSDSRAEISFGGTSYNIGGHFDLITNAFTAPVKGIYQLTMTLCKVGSDSSHLVWYLKLNGTDYVNGLSGTERNQHAMIRCENDDMSLSRTVTAILEAGDVVQVQQAGTGKPDTHSSGFEGILVQALA